jgi:hypothetical protein
MTESKVKSYVRKGKVVKSYDRTKKDVSKLTAIGTLGGGAIGAGIGISKASEIANALKKKYPNSSINLTSPEARNMLGILGAGTGAVIAGVAINKIANATMLTKEQKKQKEKEKIEKLKKIVPYQDKDLSILSRVPSGIVTGAVLGGLGSVALNISKLKKNPTLWKRLKKADLIAKSKYAKRFLKPAGKAALIAGIAGGTLAGIAGRNAAEKTNKKFDRKDIKESKKERSLKIAKAVGAGLIGAGLYGVAGRAIGNSLRSESASKVLRQIRDLRTEAKLREASKKLVDEYNHELRKHSNIKMIGVENPIHDAIDVNVIENGRPKSDSKINVLKEKYKEKGEKIGKRIARNVQRQNEIINSLENGHPNIFGGLYAPLGFGLGVGTYSQLHGRKHTKEMQRKKK